jgi:hypothetical protein
MKKYRVAVDIIVTVVVCLAAAAQLAAQSPPDPDYVRQQIFPSYADFKAELLSIVGIADPVQRESQLAN